MSSQQNNDTDGVLSLGTRLASGSYSIGKLLGRGGFGITYLGADNRLSRPIALKEFFPNGATRRGTTVVRPHTLRPADYDAAIQRFLLEARTLARFRHPNIVAVHDMFQENATAYMVMEFLKGETLGQQLERIGKPMPEDELVALVEPLVDALDRIHDAGILHRDIKPDNVILAEIGGMRRPVLIDFGAARDFAVGATVRHSVVLTPGYAPLEQYGEAHRRGPFSDIYSLAATLYHLATGVQPLPATDIAAGSKLARPRTLNTSLSAAFDRAIMRAMELKAERRPQTGGDFFRELAGKRPKAKRAAAAAKTVSVPPPVTAPSGSLERAQEIARRLNRIPALSQDKLACPVCRSATMIDPARATGKIRCPVCRGAGLEQRILEPDRCPACRKANLEPAKPSALLCCPACVTGSVTTYTRRRTLLLTRELRARCYRCAAEFDYHIQRDSLTLLKLPSGSERLSPTFVGKTKPRHDWIVLSGRSTEMLQCRNCSAEFDILPDGRRQWVAVTQDQARVPAEHRRTPRDPGAWAKLAHGLRADQGTHCCPACDAQFDEAQPDHLTLIRASRDPHGVHGTYGGVARPSSFWRALATGKRDPTKAGRVCPACTAELEEVDGNRLRLATFDPGHDPHRIGKRFGHKQHSRADWSRIAADAPLEREEPQLRAEAQQELWEALLAGEFSMPGADRSFPLALSTNERVLVSCGASHLRQKQGALYEYDTGRLWITTKRLLYHGRLWNLQLSFGKISDCVDEQNRRLSEPVVALRRWDRANPVYFRPVVGAVEVKLEGVGIDLRWDSGRLVELVEQLRQSTTTAPVH